MNESIQQLQAAALEQEFVVLARALAAEHAARQQRATPRPLGGPCALVMRSGVAQINDQSVGRFDNQATAELCGRFLMALDRVFDPEYSHYDIVASGCRAPADDHFPAPPAPTDDHLS